jgi:hypothetical protein
MNEDKIRSLTIEIKIDNNIAYIKQNGVDLLENDQW